ncbi:alcohol dehydrogenase catalytic domain-containing protein [Streptomyces hygroscopicus]|uniref:alcohol dehydrogenase catalytic domain-containing protein n=1 Tax=Streptomyces hygroscopicus TaxID=1912 RepID=UPI0033FC5C6F
MKGAVFLGDRKVELRDFPEPQPGPGEVVVAIRASGLCGSDLHYYRDRPGQVTARSDGRVAGGTGVPPGPGNLGRHAAAAYGLASLAPWGRMCIVGPAGEVRFNVLDLHRSQMARMTSWSMSIAQQRHSPEPVGASVSVTYRLDAAVRGALAVPSSLVWEWRRSKFLVSGVKMTTMKPTTATAMM